MDYYSLKDLTPKILKRLLSINITVMGEVNTNLTDRDHVKLSRKVHDCRLFKRLIFEFIYS